jgi:hypothetical protein
MPHVWARTREWVLDWLRAKSRQRKRKKGCMWRKDPGFPSKELWTSCYFLSLSILVCSIGIKRVSTSQGCWDEYQFMYIA